MANGNSQEIIAYKRSAMEKIIATEAIVKALQPNLAETAPDGNPEALLYTSVFPYGYTPGPSDASDATDAADTSDAYITIQVSMPGLVTGNRFFKQVLVTMTVICHPDHMRMTAEESLGSAGSTRMDYISVQLDRLFNGTSGILGPYQLRLISNTEKAMDHGYRCRVMEFQTQEPVLPVYAR